MNAQVLHFALLCAWGGVLATEVVIEFALPLADKTRAHYAIDLFVELPLIAGILASGVWLSLTMPLTPLHWVKIGFALAAIAVNLACAVAVMLRYRATEPAVIARYDRLVRLSGVGFVFGAPAAYIGLVYFL